MIDLEQRGIGFKSLTENIDMTTSGGKLIFHIFGALAEFERNLIRERTQAGLVAARARGKRGGRPKGLTSKQHGITLDLYEKQHPIQEICRTLQISKATKSPAGLGQASDTCSDPYVVGELPCPRFRRSFTHQETGIRTGRLRI